MSFLRLFNHIAVVHAFQQLTIAAGSGAGSGPGSLSENRSAAENRSGSGPGSLSENRSKAENRSGSGSGPGSVPAETENRSAAVRVWAYTRSPDPGCKVGVSCHGHGTIPKERGVCVQPINTTEASDRVCYDVCNDKHEAVEYGEENEIDVGRVRAGLLVSFGDGFVECPSCSPGDRCREAEWEEGRGMCVKDPKLLRKVKCWDMCDYTIDSEAFGYDEEFGQMNMSMYDTVKSVRSGSDGMYESMYGSDDFKCPGGLSMVAKVLLVLLILCCLCCCLLILLLLCCTREEKQEEEPDPPEPVYQKIESAEKGVQALIVADPIPVVEEEGPPPTIKVAFRTENGSTKTITFESRPLGFTYDWVPGMPVKRIEEGGLAQSLGVTLKWNVMAVDDKGSPWQSTSVGDALQAEIREFTDILKQKVILLPENNFPNP